jgi:hypothetical protein
LVSNQALRGRLRILAKVNLGPLLAEAILAKAAVAVAVAAAVAAVLQEQGGINTLELSWRPFN